MYQNFSNKSFYKPEERPVCEISTRPIGSEIISEAVSLSLKVTQRSKHFSISQPTNQITKRKHSKCNISFVTMGEASCSHITICKRNPKVLSSYESLHALYVSCIDQDSLQRKVSY